MKKGRYKKARGFTLVELMLVVTIIGILASVAAVHFGDSIVLAYQAVNKANLGVVRSTLNIYYGGMEGQYPSTYTALTQNPGPFLTKYLNRFPYALLIAPMAAKHQRSSIVSGYTAAAVNADGSGNPGGWFYSGGDGTFLLGCTHTDTRRNVISGW